MGVDVSICIATFRRPEGLSRLLDSLDRVKLPVGVEAEVIVVDNDREESAASVAKTRSGSLGSIRYCVEPQQNIALARNRALSEASGEWLLFIDDDEVADENWIAEYLELVERDPCDGAFGPVLIRLEEIATPWLDVETFYSRRRHPTGHLLGAGDLYTSNALVRRRLFDARGFDPAYGLSGGSDSELFGHMLRSGARFVSCDEALVVECIPPERHRFGWLAQRAFRGGCVHTRIAQSRASGGAAKRALRAAVRLCGLAVLMPLAAFGGRRAMARVALRICTQAGHLWALMGRSYEEYGAGFSTAR
ncbi:MAG: glycosyltransferase family 2 protein [Deltaproteobacteria bacterium]|jgi:succinoglycan biosynthesis protein ExoM|nr:glycosyltransferase family 2 protein [Deltaproteobacteria bacterium]